MANSAGIYLDFDGEIFLLCDMDWGRVPLGIGIAKFADTVRNWGLKAGDTACFRDGCLLFDPICIKITQWNKPVSPLPQPVCRDRWKAGIGALNNREKGLAPLAPVLLEAAEAPRNNPLCALAGPRLEALLQGLREENVAAAEEAVRGLMGLGPGLTPSGDDTLCGLLYGLNHSSCRELAVVRMLGEVVSREADLRTHRVSAAYLKAIAGGASFDRLEAAWLTLQGCGEQNFEPILEVGSSSGGDLLLGLLLAGKLCMEREE